MLGLIAGFPELHEGMPTVYNFTFEVRSAASVAVDPQCVTAVCHSFDGGADDGTGWPTVIDLKDESAVAFAKVSSTAHPPGRPPNTTRASLAGMAVCDIAASVARLIDGRETEDDAKVRFTLELEFLQCLANPFYLKCTRVPVRCTRVLRSSACRRRRVRRPRANEAT